MNSFLYARTKCPQRWEMVPDCPVASDAEHEGAGRWARHRCNK